MRLSPAFTLLLLAAACGGSAETPAETASDDANPPAPAPAPALLAPKPGDKTVFVTKGVYTANLGGIAGADAKCQEEATAAGLPGTFIAWLSTSDVNAATRLDRDAGPYVLTTGEVVAPTWDALVSGSGLQHAIDRTASREAPVLSRGVTNCGGNLVWTSTRANGYSGGDCAGWTSTNAGGWVSLGVASSTSTQWTDWCYENACGLEAHLYCIEK